MDFRRKKKRGQSQKSRRTWFSEEGYRIVWRREVCGVQVAARFQACVRVLVPYSDGQLRPVWDFVNRNRRLIKTLKAAEDECERHKQLWERACQATGIRALKELFGGKRPLGLPLWVRKKLDRRLYAILIDNRPMIKNRDEEEAQSCTESLPQASDAPGPGGPTKTSDSFCLAYGSSFGNPYPCLACRGQGTIYDPNDPPCPVEGSKYRRTIRCAACGGSGKGSKQACRQAYRQMLEAYRQEKAEYDRLAGLRRQAIKRLTKEELRALRELGI